jgi:Sulfotransferase family
MKLNFKPPIFILSSPRSYSSVISSMIGQHSELFAFPEINLILADDFQSYIALMKKQILNLKDGDLRSIAYIFFGDQSFDSIKKASDFLIQNPQIKTNDVFKSFQEKVHPKRLITKSPLYASDLSYLKRLPTDTFFIHLLRNPLTQNRSLENYLRLLDLNPSNHLYLAHSENRYKGWINEQQNIETFLQEIPNNRKIRIYSEFIMREPKEAMKGLCHFLNVSDDEENIEQMLHPEKSIFASVGNDTARFGNDPKFLMHPKLRVPNESINDSIDKCPLEVKNIIKAYHYDYYI